MDVTRQHTVARSVDTLRTLYAMLLVATIVYGVIVLCWPAPPAYCVADAVVALRPANHVASLPSLSGTELELLCGTIRGDNVRITSLTSRDGLRVRICSTAPSPRSALILAEQAGREFVRSAPAYVASRTHVQSRDELRRQETQWWASLEQTLQRLLACTNRLNEASLLAEQPLLADDAMQVSTGSAPSDTPQNPAWLDVNSQVEALRDELSKLLQTRTDEHPEVQLTRNRITELTNRLNHIPPFIPPESPAATATADLVVKSESHHTLAALLEDLRSLASTGAELEQVVASYAGTRSQLQPLLDEATRPNWRAELSRPARLLARQNGNGPTRRPDLLLMAFAASAVFCWRIRPRNEGVLRSIGELKSSWGANIVASFGEVRGTYSPVRNWTVVLIRIAHWWIVLVLAAGLLLAAGDSTFWGNFLHDPTLAIREAWSRWTVR